MGAYPTPIAKNHKYGTGSSGNSGTADEPAGAE